MNNEDRNARGISPLGSIVIAALAAMTACCCCACRRDSPSPNGNHSTAAGLPAGADAEALAHARNAAVAHLEAEVYSGAIPFLDQLATLLPNEPMVFANRALATLRSLPEAEGEKDAARERARRDIERALELAPSNAGVRLIRGGIEAEQGNPEAAVPLLREALAADPDDARVRWTLAEQLASLGESASAERLELFDKLSEQLPTNLAVRLYAVHEAMRLNRPKDAARHLKTIAALDLAWPSAPADTRALYETALAQFTAGDSAAGQRAFRMMDNILRPLERFQADLAAVRPAGNIVGRPIQQFVSTELPSTGKGREPIPVQFRHYDEARRLGMTAVGGTPLDAVWLEDRVDVAPQLVTVDNGLLRVHQRSPDGRYGGNILTLALTEQAARILDRDSQKQAIANAQDKATTDPAAEQTTRERRDGNLVTADWNHDARMDLVHCTSDGRVYLLPQSPDFLGVQGSGALPPSNQVVELPSAEAGAPVEMILPFDADQDGDLDLLIGRRNARTALLRYNGDGTFAETGIDSGLASEGESGLIDGDIGDLDDDGDLDVVAVDANERLRLFENRRASLYVSVDPPSSERTRAVAVGDLNNDGRLDLVLLGPDGGVTVVIKNADASWKVRCVGTSTAAKADAGSSIQTWDYDNDGWLDLLVVHSGAIGLWRNVGENETSFEDASKLVPTPLYLPPHGTPPDLVQGESVQEALPADADRDGDLDLLLTFTDGHVSLFENDGGNKNHWYNLQLRAILQGDQRNNAFGIGSTLEIKAGRAYQRRTVRSPITHLGLGDASRTDTIRILWPNGAPQHILLPATDVPIAEDQRLKGSCPFLFAWSGERFEFVTDLIWRSPLGMRVNGQVVASPVTTQDYVKIRANQLVPRDGRYDLKIAAALWETMFFDEVKLMCVDHAGDVQILVDERFTAPDPLPFVIYSIPRIAPLVAACDHRGRDVRDVVARLDANYLGGFAKGKYQGVAEDHYLEVDLGPLPKDGPVRLIASGWIHPSDSSLNVAIAQGNNPQPKPLSVWVADGGGGWTEAIANAGFPAGKHKTIVLDLTGQFASDDHRVRLRTNLEIYWDRIGLGLGDGPPPTVMTVEARAANLGWFGVPNMVAADDTSPELPDMHDVRYRSPWRDLIGWYTRYGDTRELLAATDDRFVIMNAGDAISLSFDAPPAPPNGWTRDFVFFSDGWVKDGDWNTVDSKTVGPLPFHAMKRYPYPPEAAPTELRVEHPDWSRYHTRFVAPSDYGRRLAPEEP